MRWGAIVLLVVAALAVPAVAGSRAAPTHVGVSFTGKGGGRYLDVTRWLQDAGRECYARKTADETLSVSWQVDWNAVVTDGGALQVTGPLRRAVQGSVVGTAVRDFCDEPVEGLAEVGADWPGATECTGPMAVQAQPYARAAARGSRTTLTLQGPTYGSPPKPCELFVRNDQLSAVVSLTPQTIARLQAGHTVSMPIGTRHPTAGKSYEATRTCSQFPHVYDGIVYLYDCEDTLAWNGTLTLTPSR
jgi:hypothetical protein